MVIRLKEFRAGVHGLWACLLMSGSLGSVLYSAPVLSAPADGRLFAVEGSNTVGAHLMKDLVVDFLQSQGAEQIDVVPMPVENEYRVVGSLGKNRVYVDVAAHGSSTGFRALEQGTADIAMSSRRVTEAEVQRLMTLGDLREYATESVIAIDGLAVVVNPQNPVDRLSMETLARIFSGSISNWSDLGRPNATINLYARDGNSGTWDTFSSLVLRNQSLAGHAQRFESNDELSDRVANDPHGIGFVGLASVRQAKAVAVSDEGTEALLPKELVVATEDYALARRLFLYSPAHKQSSQARDFIAYMQSDDGQKIVRTTGFVSQNLVSVRQNNVEEGPPEYLALVNDAERLSVNLRFAEGSADLDNKARRDMLRIADYISRPENTHKRLVLVGFGDEIQNEKRADVLSRLRATAVKSALFRLGVPSEPVLGLGANFPVASNQAGGRSKNRRVEVWVLGPR